MLRLIVGDFIFIKNNSYKVVYVRYNKYDHCQIVLSDNVDNLSLYYQQSSNSLLNNIGEIIKFK